MSVSGTPSPKCNCGPGIDWRSLGCQELLLTHLTPADASDQFSDISIPWEDAKMRFDICHSHETMPEIPVGHGLWESAVRLPGSAPESSPDAHSAIMAMQPTDLLDSQVHLEHRGFDKHMFDRLCGNADAEALRATQAHLDHYRLEGGLLQRRTIGRRGDYFFTIVIPSHDTVLQQKLIQHYHEACGHLSGLVTFHLLRDKYFWSGAMRAQCIRLCQTCSVCIRWKSGNHLGFARPHTTIAAPIPMAYIVCDVMDMPATKDGYDSIFVLVDV